MVLSLSDASGGVKVRAASQNYAKLPFLGCLRRPRIRCRHEAPDMANILLVSTGYGRKRTTARSHEQRRAAVGRSVLRKSVLGRPFCLLRRLFASLRKPRAIGLRWPLSPLCQAGAVSGRDWGDRFAILFGLVVGQRHFGVEN